MFFFYLVTQYATKRQKSNVFEFHRTLDICSFIDTLYYVNLEQLYLKDMLAFVVYLKKLNQNH
jgi:hypothetical protein